MTPVRIYLTGGWGYGNLGDDAILRATLGELRRHFPGLSCTLTSFCPEETNRLNGLAAIPSVHATLTPTRIAFPFHLLRTCAWWLCRKRGWAARLLPGSLRTHWGAICQADVVVFAGGGYFNDRWFTALPARLAEIAFARSAGKPLVILGQTVGPFSSFVSRQWLSPVLRSFDLILYRDTQSARVLERHQVDPARQALTADLAALLEVQDPAKTQLRALWPAAPGQVVVGVTLQKFRPYESAAGTRPFRRIRSAAAYRAQLLAGFRQIAAGPDIRLVFIPSTRWDRPFCESIARILKAEFPARIACLAAHDADAFIGLCQGVDVMISTNMHPIILAATAAAPAIALSYFYKVDDFMRDIGLGNYVLGIDDFSGAELAGCFERWRRNAPHLGATVADRMQAVRRRAGSNVKLLRTLLEGRRILPGQPES